MPPITRQPPPAAPATPRKGSRRRADIPPEVLERLHLGQESTITLVEVLAIDQRRLVQARATTWGAVAEPLLVAAEASAGQGFMDRYRAMGLTLALETGGRGRVFQRLAEDLADTVRSWAAFAAGFAAGEDLAERLALIRPFAADPHMGVRECAWMALRPHLAADLKSAWKLLKPWVEDADPNIRRCAIEATRPRGVWCAHIESLKADPRPGLKLLKNVRADPAKYVQNSCANWLNDAAKSQPLWVQDLCAAWLADSPGKATAYICKRALRSL